VTASPRKGRTPREVKAADVMHRGVSLREAARGRELLERLAGPYPGLPVVNDAGELQGIVSGEAALRAIREGSASGEVSAETLVRCGHPEHGACGTPLSVSPEAPLEEVADVFLGGGSGLTVLPVVSGRRLVGVIVRADVLAAFLERGSWEETAAGGRAQWQSQRKGD